MNALSISLHAFRRFVNSLFGFFFFNDTATTEIYTLSLHDALPIFGRREAALLHLALRGLGGAPALGLEQRSEEHTSELQSQSNLVCRLLLEKKKNMSRAYPSDAHERRLRLTESSGAANYHDISTPR